MENAKEFVIVESVVKPVTHRGRAGKGNTKYPFGRMAVGAGYKWTFSQDTEETREKEERKIRTAVLHYVNTHTDPHIHFETFTVTADSEPNKEYPGAGIWVRRLEDLTDEEVSERTAKRLKMSLARKSKGEKQTLTQDDVGTLTVS